MHLRESGILNFKKSGRQFLYDSQDMERLKLSNKD